MTDPYFKVIRQTDDFLELQSRNTSHCWIIKKSLSDLPRIIYLYHKHTPNVPYYHKQCNNQTVSSAIKKIKDHDYYFICNQPSYF
jgi:hypothetical protein